MKIKRIIPIVCFALLMAGLGSSDALRGIFAPVFQDRYSLSDSQISMVVVASYVGNLLFLSVGGKLLDTFSRKKVMLSVTAVWAVALLINILTDNYICILLSMFLALGASTLLNTSVNIITPTVCAGYAGLMVNIFFFVQGIGTSTSQYFLGKYAFSFAGWKFINVLLFTLGAVVMGLIFMMKVPDVSKGIDEKKVKTIKPQKKYIFWLFAAMFGFYFIAEHGIMNWFLSYCINSFSMEAKEAAGKLSIFWTGMTLGRLLFAPVVQKLGVKKSLYGFGGVGTVMFVMGCILGQNGILLLGLSGFVVSILYPTMVLLIQQIYSEGIAATRTGQIISVATAADIVFNIAFGFIVQGIGYRSGFMIMPVCMVLFYSVFVVLMKKQR